MRYLLVTVLLLAGCATQSALDDSLTAIGHASTQSSSALAAVSTSAQIMLASVAAVSTRTQELLAAVKDEVASTSSETRALLATTRGELAASGSAATALSGRLGDLVVTVRDGLSENAVSARATTAAVASTTHEVDLLLAGLRPNLVAASTEAAGALANVRAATETLKQKAEAPMSPEVAWTLRVIVGAVVILLIHAVWSHLRLSRLVRSFDERNIAP